jgi:hypothetical protein
MQRHPVGLVKRGLLVDPPSVCDLFRVVIQVLCSCDDIHVEGLADLCDLTDNSTQADNPKLDSRKIESDRGLPPSGSKVGHLLWNVACGGKDERP